MIKYLKEANVLYVKYQAETKNKIFSKMKLLFLNLTEKHLGLNVNTKCANIQVRTCLDPD